MSLESTTSTISDVIPELKERCDRIKIAVSLSQKMQALVESLIGDFLKEYYKNNNTLIQISSYPDCFSPDSELLVRKMCDPDDFPDVILSNNYDFFFKSSFSSRFLNTGIYIGYTPSVDWNSFPSTWRCELEKNNLGILCFTSSSVVIDLSVSESNEKISSWRQILVPKYEDGISVYGITNRDSISNLIFIESFFGQSGIIQYAKNIADIKHYSIIADRIGNKRKYRTPINLVPDIALKQLSSKNCVFVPCMNEGKMLNPVFLLVKADKFYQCKQMLDFLSSPSLRLTLSKYCLFGSILKRGVPYYLPNFSYLVKNFKNLDSIVCSSFFNNLNTDRIASRMKLEGG